MNLLSGNNLRRCLFCIAAMLILTSSFAFSQSFPKKIYLGLTLPYNTVGGDFDGSLSLYNSGLQEGFYIPDADGAIGFGAVAGYEKYFNGKLGFGAELAFERTSHDVTQSTWTSTATLIIFSGNLKAFYDASPVEPYLLFGISVPRFTAKNGSVSGTYQSVFEDARFTGVGINLGAGINLYVMPKLNLNAGITYRYINYSRARGIGDWAEIPNGLKGSGINITGGLIYSIPLD
nr:porin family protein [candidate division Zixibacteria bacterium]